MLAQLRAAVCVFLLLTLITGVAYPLVVSLIAQTAFHHQAEGSLIYDGDRVVGSALIGQAFDDPGYFWSRPSATAPVAYDSSSSSGSNLGPTNPDLATQVAERVKKLRAADPDNADPVPVDLVTTSASGLDPQISSAAAEYQVSRVAKARGLGQATVRKLVAEHTEDRTLGLLGEPRVNVLLLNRALDVERPLK